MAWRHFVWILAFAWSIFCGNAEEQPSAATGSSPEEGDDATEAENITQNATLQDREKMMLACRQAIWKKWSNSMQEVGELVNMTLGAGAVPAGEESSDSNESEPKLNYSEATRMLANAQLASCARSVTLADIAAASSGELSDAAAERLLGGPALGLNLTEEERELFESAVKNQQTDADAPQLLGIQVHNIPVWLQIFYMVAVVGALAFVIMKAVGMLTNRDKEMVERQEKKKEEKEAKGKSSGSKKTK